MACVRQLAVQHCSTVVARRSNVLRQRLAVSVKAQEDDKGASKLEDLFAAEVRKRNMERGSGSSMEEPAESPASERDAPKTTTTSKSPFESSSRSPPRASKPPPSAANDDQRQKSMSLVNEGLEGLIPRASELLKLGSSVFLAFLPIIAAISVLWALIYVSPLGGNHFVHGGDRAAGPPAYVSPEQLLSEPTVDPYIPFSDMMQ